MCATRSPSDKARVIIGSTPGSVTPSGMTVPAASSWAAAPSGPHGSGAEPRTTRGNGSGPSRPVRSHLRPANRIAARVASRTRGRRGRAERRREPVEDGLAAGPVDHPPLLGGEEPAESAGLPRLDATRRDQQLEGSSRRLAALLGHLSAEVLDRRRWTPAHPLLGQERGAEHVPGQVSVLVSEVAPLVGAEQQERRLLGEVTHRSALERRPPRRHFASSSWPDDRTRRGPATE